MALLHNSRGRRRFVGVAGIANTSLWCPPTEVVVKGRMGFSGDGASFRPESLRLAMRHELCLAVVQVSWGNFGACSRVASVVVQPWDSASCSADCGLRPRICSFGLWGSQPLDQHRAQGFCRRQIQKSVFFQRFDQNVTEKVVWLAI